MRPTFYYDTIENPTRASGILLWDFDQNLNQIKFLMIFANGRYEDFGGKTDDEDENILETACREMSEESNFILKSDDLVIDTKNCIYNKNSKYLIFLAKLNKITWKLDDFGDREEYENISRIVKWVTIEEFTELFQTNKLHIRLKIDNLIQKILDIISL